MIKIACDSSKSRYYFSQKCFVLHGHVCSVLQVEILPSMEESCQILIDVDLVNLKLWKLVI